MRLWEVICPKRHQTTTDKDPTTGEKIPCRMCKEQRGFVPDLWVELDIVPFVYLDAGWLKWRESITGLVDGCQALYEHAAAVTAAEAIVYAARRALGRSLWIGCVLMWKDLPLRPDRVILVREEMQAELSMERKAKAADEMAEAARKLGLLEEEKAAAAKRFKARIEILQQEIAKLGLMVREGERRTVDVHEIHNIRERRAIRVRCDTGEVIGSRELTPAESQRDLFGELWDVLEDIAVVAAEESEPEDADDDQDAGDDEDGDGAAAEAQQ